MKITNARGRARQSQPALIEKEPEKLQPPLAISGKRGKKYQHTMSGWPPAEA